MVESRIAQRGTGAVRAFNEAGVLGAADVHVALRLAQMAGEQSPDAVLATALAVRAVRSGSVCLEVDRIRDIGVDAAVAAADGTAIDLDALPWPDPTAMLDALRVSPLVVGGAAGPLRPLRLVDTAEGTLLYLEKYHRQEQTVRRILDTRAGDHPDVDERALRAGLAELFPDPAPDRQRVAVAVAATHRTSVIAGGPGTGKTYTVARVLAMLRRLHGDGLRIGLAAPTGKAAARLQESVHAEATELGLPAAIGASTLHRLLGWGHGGPRYHARNHLPHDVIVVDETSMVSLTMMCRLLEALRPQARLVLVGDPNQLASIDAGAVLADLVDRPVTVPVHPILDSVVGTDLAEWEDGERRRLAGGIVRLTRGRRFEGAIAALAAAVRDGEEDRVVDLLHAGGDAIEFCGPDDLDGLRRQVVDTAVEVTAAAEAGDVLAALALSERHRLLCAHRDGPFGVSWWERASLEWIGAAVGHRPDPDALTVGRPLLVTSNDYDAKIYNGDTGVVVRRGDGEPVVAFARGADPLVLHPSRLSAVQSVYAMTIHRSQGSQYGTVSVVLPEARSSLLTRGLLYTAITRAKDRVRIIGTEEAVREGVRREVRRASGLRQG